MRDRNKTKSTQRERAVTKTQKNSVEYHHINRLKLQGIVPIIEHVKKEWMNNKRID